MRQTIVPIKHPVHVKLTIPGSKSITYRALMLSALADGVSEIFGMQITQDVRVFVRALHQLGIVTQLDEKARSCIIAGGNGKMPKKQATLWCAGTKTAAQLLLAICAATPGVYYLDGSSRLRTKSLARLLNLVRRQGAQIIPNDARKLPLTLIGADTLEGGEIRPNSDVTEHLVSILLMIAPYARSPFNFNLTELTSHPKIDITCSMMAEYGVLVHRVHQGQFMVPVPQRYQAKDHVVEPDFGLAAYFFAAAAITGSEITIQAVKCAQSKQADVKFLSVLEKMGCHIHESHNGLSVKGPMELQGIEISMQRFSDSFLALAVIAPFAKSPVRITHLGSLTTKESERLMATKLELTKLGAQVDMGDNWIKIFPSALKPGVINTHQDPRIAMAFAIIGLKIPNIVIDHAESVNKFFPDFFVYLNQLTDHHNINA